ncbi:MAG TPA: SprT family zinc-dependent metalloprotease [Smithellaceae bacterium]|nr:SprT family zinc-dependent metalloprotease [Smithellaceae bacterium]HRV25548.1 SprT family zinc-dependent metalloprotease [Smithellaceae bacterium]
MKINNKKGYIVLSIWMPACAGMTTESSSLYMKINYTLRRSRKRRKTISLNISEANEIIVAAPYFTPVREINSFIQEKQDWIEKAIKKQARARLARRKKEFVTGERFPYLGESYLLEVFCEPQEKPGLLLWKRRFYLNSPEDIEAKKNLFVAWYKLKAAEHIGARVDFFSRKMNINPRGVRISSARQRWGSCSPENKLAFSFRLMMMPPDVIDYVIVHELMHIKEKSHSRRFWKLVAEAMPDYKMRQRNLRKRSEDSLF